MLQPASRLISKPAARSRPQALLPHPPLLVRDHLIFRTREVRVRSGVADVELDVPELLPEAVVWSAGQRDAEHPTRGGDAELDLHVPFLLADRLRSAEPATPAAHVRVALQGAERHRTGGRGRRQAAQVPRHQLVADAVELMAVLHPEQVDDDVRATALEEPSADELVVLDHLHQRVVLVGGGRVSPVEIDEVEPVSDPRQVAGVVAEVGDVARQPGEDVDQPSREAEVMLCGVHEAPLRETRAHCTNKIAFVNLTMQLHLAVVY